jgi:lipid A ethanolaminephosphotransferase
VSDHGESLGENNLYLHGLPWNFAPDEQKQVPLVVWLDAAAQAAGGGSLDCLKSRHAEPLSHDHLFHSVLGYFGIGTAIYRKDLDLFAPCRPTH